MSNSNEDSQQFRLLVDNACGHVIFSSDVNGIITTWNPGVENILGYTSEEWIGQPARIIFTPEDRAENVPEREMAGALEKGRTDDIRWHLKKDGTRFWAEGSMVALRDEAGTLHGLGKIMRDATERKLHEERERARLNNLFTQVPAFMAALRGPNHIFEMANPSYYQVIGHRELLGKPVAEALPEITEQGFVDLIDNVYKMGEPFVGSGVSVLLQREQDGPLSERFLDFSYQPLRDENGAITGVLVHGTDVTDFKRLEIERRRSEERFRSLVEATAQIIWEMQDQGTFVSEQPQWAAYTGQSFGEYKGLGWLDALHPEDRDRTLNAWEEAVRTRHVYRVQHRLRRHDGVYRHFAVRAAPVLEVDSSIREWIGVHNDVTERKEAESRERFLSDITARMRALLDPEEVLYETSKAVGEYTGAHRCLYIEVDEEADTLTIRRDYVNGVASIAGTFPLDSFGPPIIENLRLGNVTQSDDTGIDPRLGPEHRATLRALDIRAFLGVPLHKAGRWVAILAIHFSRSRAWTPEEAELLSAVVERTWLAVENARLYRAMQDVAAKNERIAETLQRSMLVRPAP